MILSIAIPTFNNESTVKKALLSAVRQDCSFDYEIVVVNNASTDNTGNVIDEVVSEFPDLNWRIVTNPTTVSLFENHNVCLAHASGDYVVFCHSDDELLSDALTKLDAAIKTLNCPPRLVCFGRSFFRDFGRSFEAAGRINSVVAGVVCQEVFQHGGLTPSGTCYSRKSFLECGGFLPMHSRLTPSDMSSMILFSLKGAEFLMLDRILFIRKAASTANSLNRQSVSTLYDEALSELRRRLPDNEFRELIENVFLFERYELHYFMSLCRQARMPRRLHCKIKWRFMRRFKWQLWPLVRHPSLLKIFITDVFEHSVIDA